MDDKFNAVVRRISALPFIKPCDLEEAFIKFNERAESLEDEEVKKFTLGLIDYAQVQWRERFAVQDWNLYDLNCSKGSSSLQEEIVKVISIIFINAF